MTRKQREAARREAKRIFDGLDFETRSSVLDELVWGSFRWSDFFPLDDRPAPGVVRELGELIEQWEMEGAC